MAEELREAGLRATRQRITVLRILRKRRDHPTAAGIHRAASGLIPSLSLKTVYQVVDSLVAAGLAACVSEGGAPFRYEAEAEPHDHAFCRQCGRLYDLSPRAGAHARSVAGLPSGFEAERVSLTVRGRCRSCRGRNGA